MLKRGVNKDDFWAYLLAKCMRQGLRCMVLAVKNGASFYVETFSSWVRGSQDCNVRTFFGTLVQKSKFFQYMTQGVVRIVLMVDAVVVHS